MLSLDVCDEASVEAAAAAVCVLSGDRVDWLLTRSSRNTDSDPSNNMWVHQEQEALVQRIEFLCIDRKG